MKTKADLIREYSANVPSTFIAEQLGCSTNYVCNVRWKALHPGFAKEWMRRKRQSDEYRERERERQREYDRTKRNRAV